MGLYRASANLILCISWKCQSYSSPFSAVMVKEALSEDDSISEDRGSVLREWSIQLSIWTSALVTGGVWVPFRFTLQHSMKRLGEKKVFSIINGWNLLLLMLPLHLGYYQDDTTFLILTSCLLCVLLTSSSLKGKKWKKLWGRNETFPKGNADALLVPALSSEG